MVDITKEPDGFYNPNRPKGIYSKTLIKKLKAAGKQPGRDDDYSAEYVPNDIVDVLPDIKTALEIKIAEVRESTNITRAKMAGLNVDIRIRYIVMLIEFKPVGGDIKKTDVFNFDSEMEARSKLRELKKSKTEDMVIDAFIVRDGTRAENIEV